MKSAETPPPLPGSGAPSALRPVLAIFLNFALVVFLAEAVIALLNETLALFFGNQALLGITGLLGLFSLLIALFVYGLMALTPMVPKRVFLPLTLAGPVAGLIALPLLIYFYQENRAIAWGIALARFAVCGGILYHLAGRRKFRWPWFAIDQLRSPGFRWGNLIGFTAIHAFVVLPATATYLFGCASVAVDHFTDGFVSLRPAGLAMQVRRYVNDAGKTVELVPMSHIGEPEFYQQLAASFPTDATILMEGVSDQDNLIRDKLGYQKTARDLGLAEQSAVFKPKGELVPADVDLRQFSQPTLDLLKRSMAIHTHGLNATTVQLLSQPSPADLPQRLFNDLLVTRNNHLLDVLHERLPRANHLIVPWGAAHMPGISEGVLKAGFRLQDTEEFMAIRFGAARAH